MQVCIKNTSPAGELQIKSEKHVLDTLIRKQAIAGQPNLFIR